MSYLLTVVFENGFQEVYLPNVDNKTVPIAISPSISGWREDITLELEVWEGRWQINGTRQYALTRSERPVDKVELEAGLLLNGSLSPDSMFSLTVEEVNSGNTQFDKYYLDFRACPWVKIGSGADNVIVYGNQFCSPRHAEITLDEGKPWVQDLNSVNGTFVNGRRLTQRRPLQYGDVVYIIGLKIVCLGNVLAVNNPGGKCTVDDLRIKPIRIAPAQEAPDGPAAAAEETYFLRTPRRLERMDGEDFVIEKCPPKNQQKRQPMLFTIGPAFTMMIPMAIGAMMVGSQNGSFASGMVMAVGSALMGGMWAVLNVRYQKKEETQTEQARVDGYTGYIAKVTHRLREKQALNKGVLERMMPSCTEVVGFALQGSPRLWEKSSAHEDFLTVRLGLGSIASPNAITLPKEQLAEVHDPLNDQVEELRRAMAVLDDVPVGLSLHENRMLGLVGGTREKGIRLARQLAVQIAGLHPYTEVRLCAVYPPHEMDSWDCLRFLPHTWTPDGKLRMIANDKLTVGDVMYHLTGVIRQRLERKQDAAEGQRMLPHYVVILADWSLVEDQPIAKYLLNPSPELGLSVVFLADATDRLPSGCTAIVRDDGHMQGFFSATGAFPQREKVYFDAVGAEQMERFCRTLSGVRVRESNVSSAIPDMLTFLDMYKTSRVEELDMLHKWLENRTYESMKSMVGYKSGNQPLFLDIHEKYHGPHGLVAGTTGSGKSETLQSYILSLAVNYHPHEVAFILIDYKGGGMAQSFLGLPHLSGVITNLGGNATNRALLSINAEIKSRQRIFNEYKVKHIDAYIELYRSGVASVPMPHLLIIADEFAELKKEQPEFVRALVSAARVGRSLGVNLILATQKPSGVVDDEIWSNTRFRLCLRVADKQDSNEMLKRPDAAHITGTGRGFFQVGNDEIFEEFQSGWSGAEYEPDIPFADDKNAKIEMINLIGRGAAPKKKSKRKSDNIAKRTQLDAVVQYAAKLASDNAIPAIKQIWLPPLPRTVYLEDLAAMERPRGFSLRLPIGLADNPETQSQYPVAVDFLQDGHLLVCGAGGSGKTTLLQTLIFSAVSRYSPREVNLYIADFSSRTMAVFAGLPHVGGVVFEGDDDKIAKVFDLLRETLSRRKSEFSQQGIGSFREYVTQKDDCPAILFLIDNYVAFLESYERYEDTLTQLSREAASYGIYLVLTMNNSGELRSRIRQNFTAGIGLQMPDRFEYEAVVGDRTEIVPEGRTPGRGLIKAPTPLEFQVALCVREDAGLSQAQALRRRFAELEPSQSRSAPKIGDEPQELSFEALMALPEVKALPQNRLALGLAQQDSSLCTVDLDEEFCFTVGGNAGTGKTNFLAGVARQAQAKGARLFLFDEPQGPLEDLLSFERVVHDDAELFALMEEILVPEFSRRNGLVADTREAGGDVLRALAGQERIVFLINDMSAFLRAVYSPAYEMSGFVEVALEKGRQHRIQFFAAVTPDDHTDMARYAAMRIWAGWGRGIHLGGMFDQQSILRLEMSAADTVRQLPAGVAYAADAAGQAVRVLTPLVKEVQPHE